MVSGRAGELKEIQDEDTSPSEITSEIPMEVEGFGPPQEEVILIQVEEHILGDLNEPPNDEIHINLPFLEAMIHMPKGAKVLKDLLSHKEKLEKAASSVKLSEECSAIIHMSLPQKEGDPGSFTLPCLIGPLAVKNALADLGASRQIHLPGRFRNFRKGQRRASPDHFGMTLPRHRKGCDRRS
ncbi:hypothetical protein Tco_0770158 [Tanacetum coccineum]|uniref:Uncharacterized protein n=1 Tax=Tanacetum coccineum TaxID=301880 RepID=A0ABQ4ZEY2_9ASTR